MRFNWQWTKQLNAPLEEIDPEIANIIELEKARQWKVAAQIIFPIFCSSNFSSAVSRCDFRVLWKLLSSWWLTSLCIATEGLQLFEIFVVWDLCLRCITCWCLLCLQPIGDLNALSWCYVTEYCYVRARSNWFVILVGCSSLSCTLPVIELKLVQLVMSFS